MTSTPLHFSRTSHYHIIGVWIAPFAHRETANPVPVCNSGFLHTVRFQTTGTVCDSGILHTARSQTTQSSPCTTHPVIVRFFVKMTVRMPFVTD